MSAPDFLKTATPKEKLSAALDVLREFREHESQEEWAHRPFLAWAVFEILQEYLEFLVEGEPLKPDTLLYIETLRARGVLKDPPT